jgi:hypothetical protein
MMLADAIPIPTGEHVVTLGTLGSLIAGVVAWVLKSALPALIRQHRDDIFQLHKECREERAEDRERHEREMAKRDERLEHVLETLMQLAHVLGQQAQLPQLRSTANPPV